MERELAPLLNLRFVRGPRTVGRMSELGPALEHLLQREPGRPRWRCPQYSLDLDYCPEQCCW
ncbi:MAG: hypothetical protein JWN74_200 [Acidobacteriaceae bacterium]|nr:hypothetical protein [Acidobacteriaceae bacterium]